ncbi:MAG: spermidine/putrescine ABC transporter substrate-binding protein [Acidimicrobiales bacterium]|nr:spermidine/putrescine ABC transporter substrate-binding protein [Acidimicrobiales bacterium]
MKSNGKATVGILLALSFLATACGSDGGDSAAGSCEVGQVDGDLALYNWAEYIDEEQLDEFAAEYGISATMDTYESNEVLQPKIAAGNSGYDVIVPSDYMVGILIAGEHVQALNKDLIPNLSNVSPDFANPSYDPDGSYAVPYQWGYTGIAVDTEVVGTDFPRSWDIVFSDFAADYSGRITLLDDPRETLGAALKSLGYSLNTTDQSQLDEAQALVSEYKDNLAAFNTDSGDELITSGETAIAHGYSGDMFTQFLETDDPSRYVFFVPEEGGTRWIDNMAIPFDAPHPCTAHTFINWLLDGEQGAALSNWNYYGTPNSASIDLLDEELNAFLTDPTVLTGGQETLESIIDTGDFETNYADAFSRAKG